eukprot:gene13019-biopygen1230
MAACSGKAAGRLGVGSLGAAPAPPSWRSVGRNRGGSAGGRVEYTCVSPET